MTNEQAIVEKNLKRFDELDFEAYSICNRVFDKVK
jgi:hypothetical protein